MVRDEQNIVVTVYLPQMPELIKLFGEDAQIDVPELVNLTVRALTSGADMDYAYRTHGCYCDVYQEKLQSILRDMYRSFVRMLNEHLLNQIYDMMVVKLTHNRAVVMITL